MERQQGSMMVNLRLVANINRTDHVAHNPSQTIARLNPYAPHILLAEQPKKTRHYLLLIGLLIAHIAGLVSVMYAAHIEPAEMPSPAPMMVSLVENPAPEPEIVPLLPTPPAPVIKPQKPIIKKVEKPQPVVEEVVSQPVQAAPVVAEVPVAAPIAPTKVVETPVPEPEPEPVVEILSSGYLYRPAPDYPPISRRMGEQGRVLLRVLLSEKGDAASVQLETSSGFARLDKAAIKAVKEWRFVPVKRKNAYVLVPVNFTIEN